MTSKKHWLSRLLGLKSASAQGAAGIVEPGDGQVKKLGRPDDKPHAPRQGIISWEPGSVLMEDLVVERKLDEGGMGAVYLVRSTDTGQQFAAKRILSTKIDEQHRRLFLAELQTWMDLPEHPHLTACRFFRTIGGDIIIFAEYVSGGSLHDWIINNEHPELGILLDMAIQFAWGLHAAHEAGVVHQDVKPGNALVTRKGVVKVTDFGLARARMTSGVGETFEGREGESILVSYGGMTPAYASPEQVEKKALNRKTDVWSWGVSVLQLFTGELFWQYGPAIEQTLDAYLENWAPEEGRPRMPQGVEQVLRRCFRKEPPERWPTLLEAAGVLTQVYQTDTGTPYPRPLPEFPKGSRLMMGEHDRRTRGGAQWEDPREWLARAYEAAGRDASEAKRRERQASGSRKAQTIADIGIYEEALQLYQKLIKEGRKELETDLACLCIHKALVHESAEDPSGTVALYDQAIAIRERLVKVEHRKELENDLAGSYRNKALTLHALGDLRGAVSLYDQAIALYERLVKVEHRKELEKNLALTYQNKAVTLQALGDLRGAVSLYDQAIDLYERLVNQEHHKELEKDLALTYQNKALTLQALGDLRGAVSLYDQAIDLFERLVNQEHRKELEKNLTLTYQNKAFTLQALGDLCDAVSLYDQAIALYERLVKVEHRKELENDLARTYQNKALTLQALGDLRGAVSLYDQAIAIRERLVKVEHRKELENNLALTYYNKAATLDSLGDLRGAVSLYDQAIALYERLVNQEHRKELENDLALTYQNKAFTLQALGDLRGAVSLYDQAIALYERLVNQEHRKELQGDLASSKIYQAYLLKEFGEGGKARTEVREALQILAQEVKRTGRKDLQDALDWSKKNLSDLL